jgi:hypothetical protein
MGAMLPAGKCTGVQSGRLGHGDDQSPQGEVS